MCACASRCASCSWQPGRGGVLQLKCGKARRGGRGGARSGGSGGSGGSSALRMPPRRALPPLAALPHGMSARGSRRRGEDGKAHARQRARHCTRPTLPDSSRALGSVGDRGVRGKWRAQREERVQEKVFIQCPPPAFLAPSPPVVGSRVRRRGSSVAQNATAHRRLVSFPFALYTATATHAGVSPSLASLLLVAHLHCASRLPTSLASGPKAACPQGAIGGRPRPVMAAPRILPMRFLMRCAAAQSLCS